MISEGIHSVVDTGNGGLLYYGLNRGARPADEHHPFGHGMEVYFWSLIVAVSIFGIGGGMSIYEGITHIQHPAPLESADHRLHRPRAGGRCSRASRSASPGARSAGPARGRSTIAAIHHGKDPSLFTVLFEDTAALLGLVVAFLGVFLSHQLDAPVAGRHRIDRHRLHPHRRGALAGLREPEPAGGGGGGSARWSPAIRRIVLEDPAVTGLGVVLTMHLGPDDVLLNIEVKFTPGLPAEEIHAAVHRIEETHQRAVPRGHPHLHRGGGATGGAGRESPVRDTRAASGRPFRPMRAGRWSRGAESWS